MKSVIKDFGERYLVHSDGRIFSTSHKKFLKPRVRAGYLQVRLFDGQMYWDRTVHSIVAECFVKGWVEGLEVDHIDSNKLNNDYTNLEWVTRQENQVRKNGLLYTLKHEVEGLHTTRNLTEFARDHNLNQGNLQQVARGKREHHKGWRVEVSSS